MARPHFHFHRRELAPRRSPRHRRRGAATGTLPDPLAASSAKPSAHATGKPRQGRPGKGLRPRRRAPRRRTWRGSATPTRRVPGQDPGKALENPAFRVLITTAGAKEKVAAYCGTLLANEKGTPSRAARPTVTPSHPTGAQTRPTTAKTESRRPPGDHPADRLFRTGRAHPPPPDAGTAASARMTPPVIRAESRSAPQRRGEGACTPHPNRLPLPAVRAARRGGRSRSHSRAASARVSTEMCPSSGYRRSSAAGQRRASHSPCAALIPLSRPPCSSSTGGAIRAGSASPTATRTPRRRRRRPPGPAAFAGPTTLLSQDHSPDRAARSAGVKPGSYSTPEVSNSSFAGWRAVRPHRTAPCGSRARRRRTEPSPRR